MASATATGGTRGRGALNSALFYVFLFLFVLVSMFPLIWIFKMSIITKAELYASPPTVLPANPTSDEYVQIFGDPAFQKALINSTIISSVTTVICLFLGSIAAYAIARLRFRFKNPVMTLILALSFFPQVAIIAPLFIQFTAVWLLVAFFRELPRDLEDAARVDGATTIQAFRKVIVPLAAPGVFTTAILTFIFAWNEFLFATTFLFTPDTQPVTVVIPNFASQYTVDYGAQAAAAVVVTVPLVILVLIFQRRIVSGLTAGGGEGLGVET